MEKKIEDFLHLYIGHQCKTNNGNPELITGKIIDLSRSGYYPVKPILRKIDDITVNEFNDIFGERICTDDLLYNSTEFLKLIKAGIDIFGLIESGIAINKTKL